jgi:hypothetical protein
MVILCTHTHVNKMNSLDVVYIVTSFTLDSNGRSHVNVSVYSHLKDAEEHYNKLESKLKYDCCMIADPHKKCDTDQWIDKVHGSGYKSAVENGHWKRPSGVELKTVHIQNMLEGHLFDFSALSWPDIRTY